MALRRTLTRAEVLAWNHEWNDRDRTLVAAALDAIPQAAYEVPPSVPYVGVWVHGQLEHRTADAMAMFMGIGSSRSGWHHALKIGRGYLEWPNGTWARNLDQELFDDIREGAKTVFGNDVYYQWTPLSTRGRSGPRGRVAREQPVRICPGCHLELPASGVCDNC